MPEPPWPRRLLGRGSADERRHLERQLQEALERLSDLSRLVSDFVWETGPDLRFTHVSERVFEMLGLLPVQLEGRELTEIGEFVDGQGNPKTLDLKAPFRDAPFEAESSSGELRYFLVSGLPHYEPDTGRFRGVRGTVRDITEFRRVEQARAAEELRRREFVADVAHELRTPLAVLRANLDALSDRAQAASLGRDVDAMTRMISQLMTFTRFEFFSLTAPDEVDLRAVSLGVVTYLAPLVIKDDKTIELAGASEPVMVDGSEEALEHVTRNLLENAIRHSPPGSTVTVRVVNEPPALHVLDQGPGVPEEKRDQVFERFRRADRRGGGTGLGLAIVRRIADAHGARVAIDGRPGGGADFSVVFPEPGAARPA